jgi:hypothetical protein
MRRQTLVLLGALVLAACACFAQTAGPRSRGGQRPAGDRLNAANPPSSFAKVLRPSNVPAPLSNRILAPRAMARLLAEPSQAFWPTRDLLQEIQYLSRRGFIPVTPGLDAPAITGSCWFPSGWRAYGFVVPAKEKLHVRLHHPNEGWFRLVMVDRWGQIREGMLQNLIPTGNPEVSYTNPREAANTVYVIVDDPGWMSSPADPFTLKVDRSWDPAKAQAPALPPVHGIWAEAKPATDEAKDKDKDKAAKAS